MSQSLDLDGSTGLSPRRSWWLALGVLAACMVVLVPTLGDPGLTYDEPAYRYSQEMSIQWWRQLGQALDPAARARLLDPDALLYYWPYARHGINFHPPLSGQLNLLTYALAGRFLRDIPARRLATAFELALAAGLIAGYLGRRYGLACGLVAGLALPCMPRVFGQAHLIETDTTGMLLWTAAMLAFWSGLRPGGRRWRIAFGLLIGLAFVQKLSAVFVLFPLLGWLLLWNLPRSFREGDFPRAAADAILSTIALGWPLALFAAEVLRLSALMPPPQFTNLFRDRPATILPGAVLLAGVLLWRSRRWLARRRPGSRLWGVERPALELVLAVLALAPAVAWLGNPGWWRDSLPRMTHYLMLCTARRGSLPDIQNLYFGQVFEYSLPWASGWVLLAITVPTTILAAAALGSLESLRRLAHGDRFPLLALLLMATPPLLRILPTPAHDGVRLLLPCFAFLAMLAGWGAALLARLLERLERPTPQGRPRRWPALATAALVLLPAAWQVARVHPYELSYFNTLIGGPAGAWKAGFELSYWYDAFTPRIIQELNLRLPPGAAISYANEQSNPVMVMQDLQSLGELRGDLVQWDSKTDPRFPYMWLLTHDSKASSFTRLLFALRPWLASTPRQLEGLRVLTVADPVAVSRAWALHLLTHGSAAHPMERPPASPAWIRRWLPPLARLWGDGLTRVAPPDVHEPILRWAEDDPEGLRAAARAVAQGGAAPAGSDQARLLGILARDDDPARDREPAAFLLKVRPQALIEAVNILIARGDAVERVLRRSPYTDPALVGGYLDQDLENELQDAP